MADKKIRSPEDATSFRYVSCAVKYEVISHSKGLLWITFTWISIIHFHAGTFFLWVVVHILSYQKGITLLVEESFHCGNFSVWLYHV